MLESFQAPLIRWSEDLVKIVDHLDSGFATVPPMFGLGGALLTSPRVEKGRDPTLVVPRAVQQTSSANEGRASQRNWAMASLGSCLRKVEGRKRIVHLMAPRHPRLWQEQANVRVPSPLG